MSGCGLLRAVAGDDFGESTGQWGERVPAADGPSHPEDREGRDGEEVEVARDLLRDLTDRAPLEDLAASWQTVQRVREWALDLCVRVESELDAGQRGEAAGEWQISRYLGAGLAILSTLRDRRWPPSQRALDTLILLYQLQAFRLRDRIVPGCQWHLLKSDGMMPPPVRDLLKDLIDQDSAAEPATE